MNNRPNLKPVGGKSGRQQPLSGRRRVGEWSWARERGVTDLFRSRVKTRSAWPVSTYCCRCRSRPWMSQLGV